MNESTRKGSLSHIYIYVEHLVKCKPSYWLLDMGAKSEFIISPFIDKEYSLQEDYEFVKFLLTGKWGR